MAFPMPAAAPVIRTLRSFMERSCVDETIILSFSLHLTASGTIEREDTLPA
jgi:hypothetical protein